MSRTPVLLLWGAGKCSGCLQEVRGTLPGAHRHPGSSHYLALHVRAALARGSSHCMAPVVFLLSAGPGSRMFSRCCCRRWFLPAACSGEMRPRGTTVFSDSCHHLLPQGALEISGGIPLWLSRSIPGMIGYVGRPEAVSIA